MDDENIKKSSGEDRGGQKRAVRMVQEIIDNVRGNGDEALKEYSRKFDQC